MFVLTQRAKGLVVAVPLPVPECGLVTQVNVFLVIFHFKIFFLLLLQIFGAEVLACFLCVVLT